MNIRIALARFLKNRKSMNEQEALYVTVLKLRKISYWNGVDMLQHLQGVAETYRKHPHVFSKKPARSLAPSQNETSQTCNGTAETVVVQVVGMHVEEFIDQDMEGARQ